VTVYADGGGILLPELDVASEPVVHDIVVGSHVVNVRVVDAKDVPVEGAWVWVQGEGGRQVLPFGTRTRTDANGAAAIPLLPPGSYALYASTGTVVTVLVPITWADDGTSAEPVELRLAPGYGTVRVRVQDQHGRPVAAYVRSMGKRADAAGNVPAEGRTLYLSPGKWWIGLGNPLEVSKRRFQERAQTVDVVAGSDVSVTLVREVR
jgi:hypothetical protein